MKKVILAIIVFLVLALAGGVALFFWLISPVNPQSVTSARFVIPKGKGLSWIGQELQKQGLIRSSLAFRAVAWKKGVTQKIQAGTYDLKPSQSTLEILETFGKGTDDVWITFLEGWRNEEIAEALAQGLGDQFSTKTFLELAKDKQGYLFPDTYLFPKEVAPETVVSLAENTFNKKITDQMRGDMQKQGRTLADVVTLASIVEREANTKESMEIVAGILQKRLENKWPLQVDATLQYDAGYNPLTNGWWTPPTANDTTKKSPYNTYTNLGLPPTPISNPGLNALTASIYPKATDYWYYISDNNGQMHYSKTVEEHNANVEKYLK